MNGGFEYGERLGREATGSTVLGWMAARHRHSSEAVWRARIAAGEVSLDGVVASAHDDARRGPAPRLAAAGHPLVGDPLYVKGGVPGPQPGLPGDGGYHLHAHRLALAHPLSGVRLDLECPPPPALREA